MTTRRTPQPYSPHDHADELGIDVQYQQLRTDNGLWIPDRGLILLRPRMPRVLERSVLAHEIAHALLAHRSTTPRHEAQANRLAAELCIPRKRLVDVAKWRPGQPALWCHELDVSHELLQAYLLAHPFQV